MCINFIWFLSNFPWQFNRVAIYQFKFEPLPFITNLAILMSFYSVTKFSILSSLNVMNRFTLEQSWDLLEKMGSKIKLHDYLQKKKKKIIFLVGTLISKIVVFKGQKIYTWSQRRQRTYYKRLFNAACGLDASLGIFLLKWKGRNHYGQWRLI